MTRTPDEIKKGLAAPIPVHYHTDFEPRLTKRAMYDLEAMHADTLALIQQLETKNAEKAEKIRVLEERAHQLNLLNLGLLLEKAQLEAERDALLKEMRVCIFCDRDVPDACPIVCEHCELDCPCKDCVDSNKWQRRGVQKEE